MKLRIRPPKDSYDVLMQRWELRKPKLLRDAKRAKVYKVKTPRGPAAFKLYSEIGYGNERTAVAFSNGLDKGVGTPIRQSDFLRGAILTKWRRGAPLADIYHTGDFAEATRHACAICAQIAGTPFAFAFTYRRLVPLLKGRIRARLRAGCAPEDAALLGYALELLKRHFDRRGAERVIHGDLHYGNIIMTPKGPRAIDPKGIRAHPLFECRNFFTPPKAETDIAAFEARVIHQIAIVSEVLGYPPALILHCHIATFIPGTTAQNIPPERAAIRREQLGRLMALEQRYS